MAASTPSSNFERLREFHDAIDGRPRSPFAPRIPDLPTVELRRRLVAEEHDEVMEAFRLLETDPSPVALAALAHELADLLYVTYGTFVACGIDADAVFAVVHRANMRKLTGPRRSDGKQLKPDGWEPADVVGVLFGPVGP